MKNSSTARRRAGLVSLATFAALMAAIAVPSLQPATAQADYFCWNGWIVNFCTGNSGPYYGPGYGYGYAPGYYPPPYFQSHYNNGCGCRW